MTIERNSSRIFNESQREVLIGSLSDQPATLGRYFLTAAYLMVDQDAGTFTLWQANPSESTDLATVTNAQSAARCDNNPPPVKSSPSEEASKTGLSGGAIAGVVVGVLAFVAVVALSVFFLRRRKRRYSSVPPAQQSTGPQEVHGSSSQKPPMSVTHSNWSSDRHDASVHGREVMQEMEGWTGPRAVYEMEGGGRSPRPI